MKFGGGLAAALGSNLRPTGPASVGRHQGNMTKRTPRAILPNPVKFAREKNAIRNAIRTQFDPIRFNSHPKTQFAVLEAYPALNAIRAGDSTPLIILIGAQRPPPLARLTTVSSRILAVFSVARAGVVPEGSARASIIRRLTSPRLVNLNSHLPGQGGGYSRFTT